MGFWEEYTRGGWMSYFALTIAMLVVIIILYIVSVFLFDRKMEDKDYGIVSAIVFVDIVGFAYLAYKKANKQV
jgi:hypothetical protein